MIERVRSGTSLLRGPLLLLSTLALLVSAAACSESLDGGAACPALCPSDLQSFRDTSFEAVILDTSLAGFPSLGLSPLLLLANRPDTIVTLGVLRFDYLTTSFLRDRGSVLDSISTVDSVYLTLPLDSTGRHGAQPVTLEVFDVDTPSGDTAAAAITSLFRPDRRIGSVTVIPDLTGDTLFVPLNRSVIEGKIAANQPLRVGLQLAGGNGQLRIVAFTLSGGAPTLQYDPATDTTYAPVIVPTSSRIAGASTDATLSFQVYSIVRTGSPSGGVDELVVGGYPASRTYLRFNVPPHIIDSSTIVRAELVLTQRRSTFASFRDSVGLVPMVPATALAITDIRRILDLSAQGSFSSISTKRLLPSDSGQQTLNVLTLVRTWRMLPTDVPRALAFRIENEGAQPSEVRFFSSEAVSRTVRPRLRITYLPRSEFALP